MLILILIDVFSFEKVRMVKINPPQVPPPRNPPPPSKISDYPPLGNSPHPVTLFGKP